MKSSKYYFHVNRKILLDFQNYVKVPLKKQNKILIVLIEIVFLFNAERCKTYREANLEKYQIHDALNKKYKEQC